MLLPPSAISTLLAFAMSSSSSSSPSDQPPVPRIDSTDTVASTRWLSLRTISYTDQEGKARKWDVVTRTTKQSSDKADAVVIIPLLRHHHNDTRKKDSIDTLLVEQYRPPVGQVTVEFPAGLIDEGETPEDAALRELREETGYVGEKCRVVPQVSRQVNMSPGLTDETVHVVVVEVDLDNPYNHGTPKAELDDGEHVTVKRVELNAGLKQVLEEGDSQPIMGIYLFALGLELGSSLL
mmetsp:Transcript_5043/g.14326  ORF Transcript_5043/g.14326 Transcript_5043/m.14326 type:complete len:237 (-) Transcript_5043:1393-2103(-)